MSDEDMILVSKAELEELRKLKEELPTMLENAKKEHYKETLQMLTQRHRENPEKHREQSKKRYEQKKDEILAKRKEAYKRKKEANQVANSPRVQSDMSENSPDTQ